MSRVLHRSSTGGDLADRLDTAIAQARRVAARLGRPVLAWAAARFPAVDVIRVFERGGATWTCRVFWAHPDEDASLVGLGRAWEVVTTGEARFTGAGEAWRRCVAEAVGWSETTGPIAVGGFAFAPALDGEPSWEGFPAAWLCVPELLVRTSAGTSEVLVSVMVMPGAGADPPTATGAITRLLGSPEPVHYHTDPNSTRPAVAGRVLEHPPASRWKALVREAVAAVRSGELRKVVLARAVTVEGVAVEPATVLRRLRDGYPGCAVFAVARGDRCFLGATPERLLRVHGGQVSTGAVAGSARRGATPHEDRMLGQALLASPKDRIEHAVAVEAIRAAMLASCDDVTAAPAPSLLRLSNVQHLHTPLWGRLRDPLGLLELAGRLHPTPAVGGVPREAALAWIARREGFARGWYAGPVGWLDAVGNGEFSVAIRSALLRGDRATLFAGCGIVADSDPEAEYAESCLKLRPLADALEVPGALSGCR